MYSSGSIPSVVSSGSLVASCARNRPSSKEGRKVERRGLSLAGSHRTLCSVFNVAQMVSECPLFK